MGMGMGMGMGMDWDGPKIALDGRPIAGFNFTLCLADSGAQFQKKH